MPRTLPSAYRRGVRRDALAHTAVIRGAFRGFAVLFVGGMLQPLVGQLSSVLAYAWLPLVAIVAFIVAAALATPSGTPTDGWRQAPVAAVASYLLIVPLVRIGAGELPIVQLVLTTVTAVLCGTAVGLARTHFFAARAADRPA